MTRPKQRFWSKLLDMQQAIDMRYPCTVICMCGVVMHGFEDRHFGDMQQFKDTLMQVTYTKETTSF
jgi:hypothetical protein